MKENQKGVSLYLVVLIMSVMMGIVLGLTSVIIGGAKTAGNLGNSVRAFSAADTGIEYFLYSMYKGSSCSNISQTYIDSASNYGYTVTVTGSCTGDGTTKIDSTGTCQDSVRELEVTY
jgi:hypothetical protein